MDKTQQGSFSLPNFLATIKTEMELCKNSFHNDLSKIRTGRAQPSLLEHIRIDYHGSELPLQQLAAITVPEPRLLQVEPWEKSLIPTIEKAIHQADLGLNPVTTGQIIRVVLPALTEERRKEFVHQTKQLAEQHRVRIRNIRNEALKKIKTNIKSEDEEHRVKTEIQKLTDQFINEIDQLLARKEKELLEV